MQDKIRFFVKWSGGFVDQDQFVAAIIIDQAGSGVDNKRSTADYQHVGTLDIIHGAVPGIIIKTFLIQDNIRLDDTAAIRADGDITLIPAGASGIVLFERSIDQIFYFIAGEEPVTSGTMILSNCPVNFIDFFTSGFLMEAVDVLGYNGLQLAGLFKLGKLFMRDIGFNAVDQDLITVETIEFGRFFHKKRMAQYGFGRIIVFLIIESVNAAEIGNTALCGYTRASEEDYGVAGPYHFVKSVQLIIHIKPPILLYSFTPKYLFSRDRNIIEAYGKRTFIAVLNLGLF